MVQRKFRADHLFTGKELLGSEYLLVTKPDGEVVEVVSDASAEAEILSGVLCPGFINSHCHLELAHMQGLIPEKTGLTDFVYRIVTERYFGEEEIERLIEQAEAGMLQSGIVAVGDICNNISTLPQKLKKKAAYYNFIEASGWNPAVAVQRFARSKKFYDQFIMEFPKTSIVPHAAYSVSENLWELIKPCFKGKVVSIHNQETPGEDEFFIEGKGELVKMYEKMMIDNSFFVPLEKSSIRHTFSKLSKAAEVILVHNTFIKQDDIDHIKESTSNNQRVSFCICINANLYIEDAVPPMDMLMNNNCNIILGTDSIASNRSLNILDEMISIQKHFPFITLDVMLGWATINGARALQMDDVLGSFEKGKKPGVVLIEGSDGVRLNCNALSSRIL